MSNNNQKHKLTTAFGIPVADDQNSLTAGERGPVLMQDVHLLEKLAHFDRERIPERVVHAKGAGAGGYFEVTADVTKYTKAKFLSEIGKRTEVFARFSTVGGEKGSADAERDPRGFALKFYTEEGNYDLVGNNTPVFFIRDPLKFPDFIHTQKRNPANNCKDPDMFWDFLSLTPESIHQVTILFSDRGIPATFRNMNGYSSHTFKWYNERNEYFWVQYHFKTDQGIKNLTRQEAEIMRAKDPDHATRDLYDAIERGDYPSWTLQMQIMTPEQAKDYRFDILDITKVWPHADFPPIEVGKLVLERNPENYFAEIEQAAFEPSNIVPGISFSPDKMLQGRIMSYADAHRYRIGVNYASLPVNKPHSPVHNYHRDGNMRFDDNDGSAVNYEPNSMGGPVEDARFKEPPLKISGDADRYDQRVGSDDYSQPGDLFHLMDDSQKEQLFSNIAEAMQGVPERIKVRQLVHFYKADPAYGNGVAAKLGIEVDQVTAWADLSLKDLIQKTTEEAYSKA